MNHLTQLIESREKEFKTINKEMLWVLPEETDSVTYFLSESIRLAYLSGIQRAKELVGEKVTALRNVQKDVELGWSLCNEETLQNIDNEIKSYEIS